MPRAPRVWLIGEQNPYGGGPRFAFYFEPPYSAGGRLCNLILGTRPRDYLRHFHRRNLLGPGNWSAPKAREAAAQLSAEIPASQVVCLFGRRVLEAWLPLPDFARRHVVVALPHLSARNRLWNDPDTIPRTRASILSAAPWLAEVIGGAERRRAERAALKEVANAG